METKHFDKLIEMYQLYDSKSFLTDEEKEQLIEFIKIKKIISQTEISDEEIKNCVGDGMHDFYKGGFIEGAKWYREQLKKK